MAYALDTPCFNKALFVIILVVKLMYVYIAVLFKLWILWSEFYIINQLHHQHSKCLRVNVLLTTLIYGWIQMIRGKTIVFSLAQQTHHTPSVEIFTSMQTWLNSHGAHGVFPMHSGHFVWQAGTKSLAHINLPLCTVHVDKQVDQVACIFGVL